MQPSGLLQDQKLRNRRESGELMKITKGDIIVELENGDDPYQAINFLNALEHSNDYGYSHPPQDPSILTPKQREIYNALLDHPEGAHYTVIAEETGLAPNVVNGRLAHLHKHYKSLVQRTQWGVYQAVR
ncbi:hypothetical protein GJ25_gp059 [Mycobacterium phage Hawkeye]|uniref:Uncharacterized protein n=1 Tax=Mycobacterium phage Hawkeye TaxID=1458711 RepID=X2KT34_9CAUD|nr:hypothetical protein GJ25_gp059 [Mycobacterium phage Hawkeye]AHN84070.1 hypothetical protein PBI_HAWKEYE_59 [Mycobacterium phage Hawkeye]